jgi:diacylglycerol kinase family enzyme
MGSPAFTTTPRAASDRGSTVCVANGNATAFVPDGARERFAEMIGKQLDGARVMFTECSEDIANHARAAVKAGASRIVACGGDGTISAIAAAIAGTDVVLGIIPHGTFNHFAKDLGIPLDTDQAIEVLRAGRIQSVDTGEVNGRLFVNNAGLGLYPDAVAFRERLRRRGVPKVPAMIAAVFRSIVRYPLIAIRVIVNGKMLLRRTPVVFVGNNEYVVDTPLEPKRASISNGELCLYIPHPQGRLGFMSFTIRALFGKIQSAREIDIVRTPCFTIDSPRSRVRVSLDGEIEMMAPPLEFIARAAVLRVIVP